MFLKMLINLDLPSTILKDDMLYGYTIDGACFKNKNTGKGRRVIFITRQICEWAYNHVLILLVQQLTSKQLCRLCHPCVVTFVPHVKSYRVESCYEQCRVMLCLITQKWDVTTMKIMSYWIAHSCLVPNWIILRDMPNATPVSPTHFHL